MKLLSSATALPAVAAASAWSGSLYVDEAPQSLRPYVLPKLAGQAVSVGSQVYRFAVTGNSSDGAFTLMNTASPDSTSLGVLPHIHKAHYENFYCSKGSFQVWAKKNGTEQGRVMTQGDYAAVPHNTIHTFQVTDPDSVITGVIQPGGFEELFVFLGESYSSSTGSPFVPSSSNNSAGAGSSSSLISALESFDVYSELEYSPRRDLVNGTAPATDTWHNGPNALGVDGYTPNFIAKNRGPKYLNTENAYKIVTPLVTGKQSGDNFTMGTITMSPLLNNMTAPIGNLSQHIAFQMEEGALDVTIGMESAKLIQGDVVFIPAGTPFKYSTVVPFTKFLYVSAGADGLDHELLSKSIPWGYTSYPTYAGFKAS
ncbi:quercetin 2,3-dioxygenase [Saccharata proteae CBS 121410]|uniref:Quercetin 2,3-dioxygenase n=1 Tax=Saccharata proteae CBS 121410 TaxID=1314787 RepID=A0A9P4LZD0_9PEZI|nr:quercetin 2,3-dioxygenase [Saccharata proteae CBS 121410]